MFYPHTIKEMRRAIESRAPGTSPISSGLEEGKPAPLSYLLWMCSEVEAMDTASAEEAAKAGRWIGWMCAMIELHSIWNNDVSRDHIRKDRANKFDVSHSS